MAAVFQAIGTQGAGTNSFNVAWPTHVAGDLGLMVIETGGEGTTLTPPAGWTAVTGSPVTDLATTAGSKLQVWYKFAASAAEANVATGDSGDHQVARIVTFRGVNQTTPFDATPVTGNKTTASTTVTWDSITTVTAGSLIVLIASRPDDSLSTTAFSAPVNANLTSLTEQGEAGSNAGHGGGFVVVTGTKATAGATGTTTCTGPNTTNAEITIALRDATAPQSTSPTLLTNTSVLYTPSSSATVSVAPALVPSGGGLFSPTATPGPVSRSPSLLTEGSTLFAPVVSAGASIPLLRFDRANYVRNSAALGAVVGTPGTPPRQWSIVTGAGISSQIVATGIDVNGRQYVDIRLFGTGTGSSTNGVYIENFAEALIGDRWNASAFVSLVSGTVPTQFQIVLRELNSGGNLTAALGATLSGITGTSTRYGAGRALTGGTTARVALWLQCSTSLSETIDFTFRVAGGQLSYGSDQAQTYAATHDLVLPRQFHTPTVTQSAASQQIAPTLISEGNTLYAPTATPGAVSASPALLTNSSTLYTPSSSATSSVAPSLLTDGDTLYTPTSSATYSVAPALHTNTSTLYTPSRSTTYSVAPSLHTNSSTLYTPSAAPTTSIAPALLTDGDTLYVPTSSVGAVSRTPTLLTNSSTLYTPTVSVGSAPTQSVTPSLYTNTSVLYTPTRTTAYSLAPALLTNASTLYAPTSVPGSVSRVPSLLTNTSTLYNPTSAATYSVQPSLYSNTPTFYTPSVAFDLRVQISWIEITPIQGVNIAPLLLSNSNTLYAPTSSVGPVSRTPDLLTNASVLYAPTTALTYSLTPALLSNGNTLYAPSVYTFGSVAPGRLDNVSVLYTPTRTTGPVSRTPALLTNTSVLYTPTTAYVVAPTLLTNSSVHYAPTVRPTTAVAPALLTNTSTLYAPTRSATVSVAPALLTNSSTLYTPTRSTTVSVAPALLTDGDTLYTPVVSDIKLVAPALLTNSSVVYVPTRTVGPADRSPALLVNSSSLYVPSLLPGPISRTPSLHTDPDEVFSPVVLSGQKIAPSLATNVSAFYVPSTSNNYPLTFPDYVDGGYSEDGYSATSAFNVNGFFQPSLLSVYSALVGRLDNASQTYSPILFAYIKSAAAYKATATIQSNYAKAVGGDSVARVVRASNSAKVPSTGNSTSISVPL